MDDALRPVDVLGRYGIGRAGLAGDIGLRALDARTRGWVEACGGRSDLPSADGHVTGWGDLD